MSEWIPVIHDAIKIGLGALIGGFFAVLGTWLVSKRKIAESLLNRHIEDIAQLSERFEQVHSQVWRILPLNVTTENPYCSRPNALLKIHIAGYAEREVKRLDEYLSDDVLGILQRLHEIEGRLTLISFKDVAQTIAAYRREVMNDLAFRNYSVLSKKPDSKDENFFKTCAETILFNRLQVQREPASKYKTV